MSRIELISRCLKDEQINIAAMAKGFEYNGKKFFQTILCKNIPIDNWYILVPKVQQVSFFQESSIGRRLKIQSKELYGYRFENFPLTYVAKAVKKFTLTEEKNTSILWSLICENLFPLWDPNSPKKHIHIHSSHIILFRVYQTYHLLNKFISDKDIRKPSCKVENNKISIERPVINDAEFNHQLDTLEDILSR